MVSEKANSRKILAKSHLQSIKEDKSFYVLKSLLESLKEKYKLNTSEILSLAEEKTISEALIPISIFDNKELSCLEAIIKYLKEEFKSRYHEIALALNRDDRTVWSAYHNALQKRKEKLPVKEPKFFIPVSILTDRKLSVLESIVSYLKDNFNLRYSEIAFLLNRDERNIWTVYSRYKKKK